MENSLLKARRVTWLVENLAKIYESGSCGRNNYFHQGKIRCFVSRASSILFKDSACRSDKDNCGKSSSNDHPRETKTSKFSKDACGSLESTRKKRSDETSEENCCDVDRREFPMIPDKKISGSKDHCERDCKLATMWRSDSSSRKKIPPVRPAVCSPEEDYGRKAKFWKFLTIFGALPVVAITSLIVNQIKLEEDKKPRPEYVPMDYMYRRTKRFPWGDGNHTFFHNPIKNPVPPHGYEVPDPNAVKKID